MEQGPHWILFSNDYTTMVANFITVEWSVTQVFSHPLFPSDI